MAEITRSTGSVSGAVETAWAVGYLKAQLAALGKER